MKIDKCVCYNKSFRRIYKESLENGIDTLKGVREIMNICNKCKMCNPYIEKVFELNKFEFDELLVDKNR